MVKIADIFTKPVFLVVILLALAACSKSPDERSYNELIETCFIKYSKERCTCQADVVKSILPEGEMSLFLEMMRTTSKKDVTKFKALEKYLPSIETQIIKKCGAKG